MTLTRLKELSAAGFPVALAPEQMLEIINGFQLTSLARCVVTGHPGALKDADMILTQFTARI